MWVCVYACIYSSLTREQALSARLALELGGQRWQIAASAVVGCLCDWAGQLANMQIDKWTDCDDDVVFNFVCGSAEKTIRSTQGALHIRGTTAKHIRLFTLVNSGWPVKYKAGCRLDDAETMWNMALFDSTFEERTLPAADEAVWHRTDCGRRAAGDNRETTTVQFSIAVGNWYTRYAHVLCCAIVVVERVVVECMTLFDLGANSYFIYFLYFCIFIVLC
jgi:hypothetical protein